MLRTFPQQGPHVNVAKFAGICWSFCKRFWRKYGQANSSVMRVNHQLQADKLWMPMHELAPCWQQLSSSSRQAEAASSAAASAYVDNSTAHTVKTVLCEVQGLCKPLRQACKSSTLDLQAVSAGSRASALPGRSLVARAVPPHHGQHHCTMVVQHGFTKS
jgi:hypothetical protein